MDLRDWPVNGQEDAHLGPYYYIQENSRVQSGGRTQFQPVPVASNFIGDRYLRNSSNYIDAALGNNAEWDTHFATNSQWDAFSGISELFPGVPGTQNPSINNSFDDLQRNLSSLGTNFFVIPEASSMNYTVEQNGIKVGMRGQGGMPLSEGYTESSMGSTHEIPASTRTDNKAVVEGPNCKCEKSQCLQLYCGCLRRKTYCGELCRCKNCHNKKEHEAEVSELVARIEVSNRHAFNADHTQKSGCNCDKSRCLKKYCECFKGQAACSSQCRCENCLNIYGKSIKTVGSSEPMQKEIRLEASIDHRVASAAAFPEQLLPALPPAAPSIQSENGAKESSPNSDTLVPLSQSNITVGEEMRTSPALLPSDQLCQGQEAVNTGHTLPKQTELPLSNPQNGLDSAFDRQFPSYLSPGLGVSGSTVARESGHSVATGIPESAENSSEQVNDSWNELQTLLQNPQFRSLIDQTLTKEKEKEKEKDN